MTKLLPSFIRLVIAASLMSLPHAYARATTNYHCTIITSFTPASASIYLDQFQQLQQQLNRDKIRVLHLTHWQDKLDARTVRQLRQRWQLSYRNSNAVLLDAQQQLVHRYEQGFDLVDALMRCPLRQ